MLRSFDSQMNRMLSANLTIFRCDNVLSSVANKWIALASNRKPPFAYSGVGVKAAQANKELDCPKINNDL